jgi:DNA-directed RNA polymerase subunit H (RpoH/RPB5)
VVDLVETLEHLVDLVDLVVVQDEILGHQLVALQQLVKVIMEEVNKEIVMDLLVEEEELGKLDIADGLINMLETKS